MAVIENLLISGLIAWGIASFCYAFRVRGVHGLLRRANVFTAYVHWTMFGGDAGNAPDRRDSELAIEYRDLDAAGGIGPVRPVSTDFACGWRGFVWIPQRRVALQLRSVASAVKAAAEAGAASEPALAGPMERLRQYLAVIDPPARGAQREIQVVERFPAGVLSRPGPAGAAARDVVLASIRHDG